MIVLAHDGAGRLELGGRYELDLPKNQEKEKEVEDAVEKRNKAKTFDKVVDFNEDDDTEVGVATTTSTTTTFTSTTTTTTSATTPVAPRWKYYKRLRVLPRKAVRKVKIRMRYDE